MSLALRFSVYDGVAAEDDSECCISYFTVKQHRLWYGDQILIESEDGTQLYPCYINRCQSTALLSNEIMLSQACIRNLQLKRGQKVTIHVQTEWRRPYLECIHCTVHPTTMRQDQKSDTQLFSEVEAALKQYFHDAYRPICQGQRIWIADTELWIYPRGMYDFGLVTNHTRFEFMRGNAKLPPSSIEHLMTVMNL